MLPEDHAKAIILRPSWKQFAHFYLLGILTVPLLGLGLLILWFTWKKQNETQYRITNKQITAVDARYHYTIDLVEIEEVNLRRSILQKPWGIADLVLITPRRRMYLGGMDQPERLQSILEKAVDDQRKLRQKPVKKKVREPEYEAGTMERVDYLTGLWQQGLISESEFEEERKQYGDGRDR